MTIEPARGSGQSYHIRIQRKPKEKTHERLDGKEKTAGSPGSRNR
jgi:hypothetical protein